MKQLLYVTSAVVTLASILLSIALVLFTSVNAQVAVIVAFTPLILSLGFAAYSAIRLELADVDSRRFGSLPLQQLTGLPDLEPSIVSMVGDTSTIKQNRGPFMFQLATEQAQQAAKSIREIADGGHICASEEELRLVRLAVAYTERRIRAVAARGASWWERPEADAYWHAYEAAAKRLEIMRVFVVRPDEDSRVLERVLERHAKAGMKTFVVDSARIPEHHLRPLVIFDERLIHRHPDREQQDGRFRVEFSDRPEDLLAAEETFRVVFDPANETHDLLLGGDSDVHEGAFTEPRGWRRWLAALRPPTAE
jgi:hypothetical protein